MKTQTQKVAKNRHLGTIAQLCDETGGINHLSLSNLTTDILFPFSFSPYLAPLFSPIRTEATTPNSHLHLLPLHSHPSTLPYYESSVGTLTKTYDIDGLPHDHH